MRVNAPIHAHCFLLYSVQNRGTQQSYRRGIYGVVFIARERSGHCILCRGVVRHRYRSKWWALRA